MAKSLNWFQARRLARVHKVRVRREGWRRWLEYDPAVYLWFIFQPSGETRLEGGEAVEIPEKRAVVLADEFGRAEFLAHDWTDEDWPQPGENTSGTGNSPSTGSTPPPGNSPTGGANGGTSTGDGDEIPPGGPSDSGGAGAWIIFPGAAGGGPGGGGTGNGVPPPPLPPSANYTPAIELELDADPDGPGCFIQSPQEATALLNVAVPNPVGGTALVLGLSVTCLGQTQTRTVGPEAAGAFRFTGPVRPGSKLRVTVTVNDFKGHTWTVSASATVAPACLLPVFTWTGSEHVEHRCEHSSGPEDGYDKDGHYSISGQYAVNPTTGTGVTGPKTSLNTNPAHNRHETTTPYPTGTPSTAHFLVAPPSSITCDVAAGVISNVSPATLNLYAPSGTETSGTPPDECTETRTAGESGPGGSE